MARYFFYLQHPTLSPLSVHGARRATCGHLLELVRDFQAAIGEGTRELVCLSSSAMRPIELVLDQFCDSAILALQKVSCNHLRRATSPRWLADTVIAGALDALKVLCGDEIARLRQDSVEVARLAESARRQVHHDADVYFDTLTAYLDQLPRSYPQFKAILERTAVRVRRTWPKDTFEIGRVPHRQPNLQGGSTVLDIKLQAAQAESEFSTFVNCLRETDLVHLTHSTLADALSIAQKLALGRESDTMMGVLGTTVEVTCS